MNARLVAGSISGLLLGITLYILGPLVVMDTSHWRSVDGTIIDRRAHRDRDGVHRYAIYATYEYQVDGKRYTSGDRGVRDAVFEYVQAMSSSAALARAGYPIGEKVRVFYDPKAPERAALSREISVGRRWLYVGIIAFCGCGFLGSLFGKVTSVEIQAGRRRRR